MDFYCEVCNKHIEPESENKQYKSNIPKGFDKCQHIIKISKKSYHK